MPKLSQRMLLAKGAQTVLFNGVSGGTKVQDAEETHDEPIIKTIKEKKEPKPAKKEVKAADQYAKYIVHIEGKPFMSFAGCLKMAKDQDLIQTLESTMIPHTQPGFYFMARLVTKDGREFTGYGDANEGNVTKKVARHLFRMAETRALSRALRFALGLDMTVAEEMGGADFDDFLETTHSIKSVEAVKFKGG